MGSGLLATRRCAWPWAVLASMFLVCISAAVASTQQASYCKLTIMGGDEGTLQQASMTCTGSATSTITLNSTYLGRFTANFTGVNLAPTCQAAFSCLITVCTGTIVLHDSSVSWVSQLPLRNLVCVVHDSRLEVHDSFIVNNQVRPFALADNASLLLHASNISNNVATTGSGGGLYVSDHTRVDIEGGSRIQNNTAKQAGGGLTVFGNARVFLTGDSVVSSNRAGASGGGISVGGNAEVTITNSSLHHNTAVLSGGGLYAIDTAKVTITTSNIHNNTALGGYGGGLVALGNATVNLTGGSSVVGNTANMSGGGVCATDGSKVDIIDSTVLSNTAHKWGGGLAVLGNSTVTISNSSVHANTASLGGGGGVYAHDTSNVTITSSYMRGNVALINGGGLSVYGNASVVVAGGSAVSNNTAWGFGGGLYTEGKASIALTHGSQVHDNIANKSGGGVLVGGNASLAITNSSVHGNEAAGGGGGLFVQDSSRVTIKNGSVSGNTAHDGGGGLSVHNSGNVVIAISSRVSNNKAWSSGGGMAAWDNSTITMSGGSNVYDNTANASGGGLIAGGGVQLTITNSSVLRNTANESGGGVCAHDTSNVTITSSNMRGNVALIDGGGLSVYGNASVVVAGGSAVSNNTAWGFGGGLYTEGKASIALAHGSQVQGNTANSSGGGAFVGGNARFTITNSAVHDNEAASGGGGLFVLDSSQVTITNGSVYGNTAHDGGGGLSVYDRGNVVIAISSRVSNNTAWGFGGGLYAGGKASIALTHGSQVHGNIANKSGGGAFVGGNARFAITNSDVHDNEAAGGGGGLFVQDSSVVSIDGSSISRNVANKSGGGLFAANVAVMSITNSSVYDNHASMFGGGLSAKDGVDVVIFSTIIQGNTAEYGGGGIDAYGNLTLVLGNSSRIHSNQALHGSGGGINVAGAVVLNISAGCSIANNSCTKGVGGGISVGMDMEGLRFGAMGRLDAGQNAADVGRGDSSDRVTISDSSITNNTSNGGAGGGLAAVAASTLTLVNGTRVERNTANSSGGAVMVMGIASFQVDDTVVFEQNSVPRGFVGSTIVAFDNSSIALPSRGDVTKCSGGVYLGRTPCGVGEYLQHDVCVCCPPHTFSFTNSNCSSCPANAECIGASIVQPLPGYWSSSPTSIQMHRCPLFKTACDYVDESQMCRPGYKGTLCGACQLPEYGMLSPMRCGKCLPPKVQLGVYLTVSSVTVSFVTYTVHATWQENLSGDSTVLTTDIIKVLVLFLQCLMIVGSVSVPWPLSDVQQWLQAIGIVVTMGSGQALSLDCWLHYYIGESMLPIAIQRQLVLFLAPVFTFLAVCLLMFIAWAVRCWLVPLFRQPREGAGGMQPKRGQSPWVLLRKLPVTVLVLIYYAFPTLLRAALSFFACLKVDEALTALTGVPVGVTATLTHRWGYWVSAIEQQCFSGYHLRWALGLGLPSVVLWCVVVPVAMGVGLYMCRSRADSDSFREHFGFLYRTYRPECMWWEAVWAARTVLLTLISVFAFPMQRYYSVLSLLLVFWASAALQIVFQPYAVSTLHRMHLVSTSCLAATTLGALAMFAYDIQESTAYALRIAITVLVFVVNLVFVGWCCLKLAPSLKAKVAAIFGTTKKWGLCGVRRAFACVGHPMSAAQPSACAVGSAGQLIEESKDPSSLGPAERV